MSIHPTQAALGFDSGTVRRRMIVRGGAKAAGDVVQNDLAMSDAATTNMNVADANSGLVNVITPESGQLASGLFSVMYEATPDDQKGYATFTGFATAYCIKASGNIEPGDPLTVDTSGNLTADGSASHKIVAFYSPLDGSTLTSPSTRTLARVWFNGINGIGAHGG